MTSLPATEWSSSFDGHPPEQLAPAVDEVVELVRSLAGVASKGSIAVPDRPRVVTIMGDRGTGKSTVLQFALHDLRRNPDCLVLPVIDPEGFASGDSLGGWVLEHLRSQLTEAERGYGIDNATTLGSLLDEVARTQAIRWSAFLPGLEQRGLALEDFGRDAAKVPRRSVQLGAAWSSLLEAVAAARQRPSLQVVVAVDDADLAPDLLPAIVNNAQLLGASARAAVVFAAAESTLRQALEIGLIASHGQVAGAAMQLGILTALDVRTLVGRRLVKSFPRSLRVRLNPLRPPARLNFAPLGAQHTLREILDQIRVNAEGYRTLSDMFVIRKVSGAELEPSEHVLSFSDNPRDLRQLHEALVHIDSGSEHAAARALQVILEHGLETARSEIPASLPDPWTFVNEDTAPAILFDISELHFGKTVGSGVLIYRRGDSIGERPIWAPSLMARRILEHYSYELLSTEDDASGHSGGHTFGSQFSHLCFLAWESAEQNAAGERVIRNAGVASKGLTLPGGTSWSSQVGDATAESSWRYWTVPAWEAYSDYYVFSAGWRMLLKVVEHYEVEVDRFELVEYLLLTHLRLVLATQASRGVPDDIVALTVERLAEIVEPDQWPERRNELLVEVTSELHPQLERARRNSTQRELDFAGWVDRLMPLLASRLFATAELSDALLKLWESVVPNDRREAAADALAAIAAAQLNSELADADIDLLARLDPARAAPLREVRDQVTRERASERAMALKDLAARSVPPEVIETLQLNGASRDVLVTLLTTGVPADRMARIAELFPPTSGEDPLDSPGTTTH